MKFRIKYFTIKLARFVFRWFHIFPVKRNMILFSSNEGNNYACNPKYLFEELIRSNGNRYEYIWVLNDPSQLPDRFRPDVKTVRFLSPKHLFYLHTSGLILTNLGIEPIFAKRKSQTVICTHHGGGSYKRHHVKCQFLSREENLYIDKVQKLRSELTDYILSGNSEFTRIHTQDLGIPRRKFLSTGTPRNDILVRRNPDERDNVRVGICRRHNIPYNNMLVLYAPTFRGTHRHQYPVSNGICSSLVAASLKARFGKDITFLFRRHRHSLKDSDNKVPDDVNIVDVSDYGDMQELLLAADVLITDYSSSIWDFCQTFKPGFLYMPDLKDFMSDRGFNVPLDRMPFPYAETPEGLCALVENYSEEESRRCISAHLEAMGSFEKGTATNQVVDLVGQICFPSPEL